MDGETIPTEAEMAFAPRLKILGGEVDVVTSARMLDFVDGRIRQGRRGLVANHNLHSLHLIQRSAAMRRFYAMADLVEIDSTPMILWARLLGRPVSRRHRCTYLDWREDFWRLAAGRGWRVFYLGGAPGVAARGAEAVRGRWPSALIGARDGYFDMDGPDNAAVMAEIAAFRPDVLLVGMGMPRQEAWIAEAYTSLPACVVFPVGASFDYEAGAAPTPPRWAGRMGLEWLFRLIAEPRRLARRYLVEPWSLIGPAIADVIDALRRQPARA